MTEPGTPAPDLAALHARARRIENLIASGIEKVVKLLTRIETVIEPQTSEPRSSTRLAARGKPRRKDVDGPPPWITSALSETREEMAALGALAKDIITALSQVLEESPHAEYDALGQGRRDLGREEVRQGGTPADTAEGGSHEQAVLASTESHAASKPSTQTIAATSPEVISDAAQQQDSSTAKQDGNAAAQGASTHQRRDAKDQAPANAHGDNSTTSIEATGDTSSDGSDKDKDNDTSMRDCEQVPPSPSGGTDAAASAASASRSAHRQAAASNGQHDIPEADRQPKSGGGGGGDQHATTSGEQGHEPENGGADTVMTDGDQQASGPEHVARGDSAAATTRLLDENDSIQPVPNPDKPDNRAGDPRPSVGGAHPADEPRSPQPASRQATANYQGDIPATNHTPEPEAEASVSEDEDVNMGGSDAAQREGNAGSGTAGSGTADHRSARSSALEDDTGGDRSEANPQTQPTTANPTGQGAGAQVNMQSPFNGATPEKKTMQLPTTPNSQGSDTTEDTSRATTPDTHLTSPDTSVPDSPSQFTLSEADMGEGLVEALERIIKRDDSMHKISVPNLPIDLDLIKAALKAGLSAPKPDWQFTANRFVPGPKGEGYVHAYISKHRSHFAFPDFPDKVVIPTKEEARKWLDDYFDNPPEGIVPYFTGHLDLPYGDLLNPGAMILDNPKLLDLHRPYWHIGGDKSANRFHVEDYNCSEDESPCGLRSANLVLEGVKLWTAIETHHTKKFEAFVAKNWDCNGCSQRVGHQSLLISPLALEREGIDFVIEVQAPGDLMIPGRSQYHMVVNMDFNIAMSMNHLQRGDRLKSTALRQCVKCGVLDDTVTRVPPPESIRTPLPSIPDPPPEQSEAGSPLVSEAPKSPKRPAQTKADPRGRTRACTQKNKKLGEQINAAFSADPLCSIPTVDLYHPPPLQTEVLVRAASIRSKVAMNQLIVLTREHTQLCSNLPEPEDSIDRQIIVLNQRVNTSALSKFRVRLAQVCLARVVDDEKGSLGRRCASHTDLEPRAKRYGVDNIHYHLQQGRQWIKICGPHEGLLPLILLSPSSKKFKVTSKGWEELIQVRNHKKLEAFHKLLDDPLAKDLDAAGRVFLAILDGGQKAVGWELALSGAEQAKDLASALKSYRKLSQTSS
ncbi:JmjC domain-containing protein [Fusarium keratoplasticum]|nr:JmjC domain-containing protein [Fusarium keratoplasticum]